MQDSAKLIYLKTKEISRSLGQIFRATVFPQTNRLYPNNSYILFRFLDATVYSSADFSVQCRQRLLNDIIGSSARTLTTTTGTPFS